MVTAAYRVNVQRHPLAGIYTFGQPRVGDPIFRDRYNETLRGINFRCVNDRDPVPHLPPQKLTRYEYVGQVRLLLPNGHISDKFADEMTREPEFLAQSRTVRGVFLELPRFLFKLSKRIKDHSPQPAHP